MRPLTVDEISLVSGGTTPAQNLTCASSIVGLLGTTNPYAAFAKGFAIGVACGPQITDTLENVASSLSPSVQAAIFPGTAAAAADAKAYSDMIPAGSTVLHLSDGSVDVTTPDGGGFCIVNPPSAPVAFNSDGGGGGGGGGDYGSAYGDSIEECEEA